MSAPMMSMDTNGRRKATNPFFTVGWAVYVTGMDGDKQLERAMGIEPTALAWEARVLPLYDARM